MGVGIVVLFLLFLIVLLLGIWTGFLLSRRHRGIAWGPPPPPPATVYKIPDHFNETNLSTALNTRLQGTPANGVPNSAGSTGAGTGQSTPSTVVWVDHGNEVLVHLDSTTVRILDRMVLVSVDLETDQTERTPLICSFAVSGAGELGGLVATTDELPQGSGLLASCWGKQLQSAVWSSLIGLANDHATERSLTPRAISAKAGTLSLNAGAALTTLASTGSAV